MAINQYFNMLPSMPGGGRELLQKLKTELKMETSDFSERWAAD
jgi:hypothetical protein